MFESTMRDLVNRIESEEGYILDLFFEKEDIYPTAVTINYK